MLVHIIQMYFMPLFFVMNWCQKHRIRMVTLFLCNADSPGACSINLISVFSSCPLECVHHLNTNACIQVRPNLVSVVL